VDLVVLYKEWRNLKPKKAPKGQKSPGAYRMGIFWKIHFINPPEVQSQLVG
jgi:hypothetical protein